MEQKTNPVDAFYKAAPEVSKAFDGLVEALKMTKGLWSKECDNFASNCPGSFRQTYMTKYSRMHPCYLLLSDNRSRMEEICYQRYFLSIYSFPVNKIMKQCYFHGFPKK